MPAPAKPDPRLLGDFFMLADVTLGALGEVYGVPVAPSETGTSLATYFVARLRRPAQRGDLLQLGPIVLIAHAVADGRVTTVGLQLAEPEPIVVVPKSRVRWV